MSVLRNWAAKLRPRMWSSGAGGIQIGLVSGDLNVFNVITPELAAVTSREWCGSCPLRCRSNRPLVQDTHWSEFR